MTSKPTSSKYGLLSKSTPFRVVILRIAKIAALFVAASVGHYIGDLFGSRPLDALPYEYWGGSQYESNYLGVFLGAFTMLFAYLATRLLRFPELVALFVAFVFSIVRPVVELSTTGELMFSFMVLKAILGYQASFFLGLLATYGLMHLIKLSIRPFRSDAKF